MYLHNVYHREVESNAYIVFDLTTFVDIQWLYHVMWLVCNNSQLYTLKSFTYNMRLRQLPSDL